jgi:hypothetical protein
MEKETKKKKTTNNKSKSKKVTNPQTKKETVKKLEETKKNVIVESDSTKESKEIETKAITSKDKKKPKKEEKKLIKIENEENKVVKKFIIVLLVVILCVVAIYLFTRAFVSKDLFDNKESNNNTTETSFNYDITILGSAFNRPYDEYYVIAYKKSDEQANYFSTIIQTYTQKENHIKIYMADLDDYMNKSYYDKDNVNKNATKASELKVGDYTLIKFNKGKIAKYIEGKDNIVKELE